MADLIEIVAQMLHVFDGAPTVEPEQAEETREAYRNRAVMLVARVRDHDAGATP